MAGAEGRRRPRSAVVAARCRPGPVNHCDLCGEVVGASDGVLFGAAGRAVAASAAHVDCVAVETLRLIYLREVDPAGGL